MSGTLIRINPIRYPITPGQKFVRWAKYAAPDVYKRIASTVIVRNALNTPQGLSGLGAADGGVDAAVESAATQPGFMESLAGIISSLGTYQAQKDCSKYNLELIKAGRPTVPCGDVAGGVNVGLDANTRELLKWGGIALLAILAVSVLKKSR